MKDVADPEGCDTFHQRKPSLNIVNGAGQMKDMVDSEWVRPATSARTPPGVNERHGRSRGMRHATSTPAQFSRLIRTFELFVTAGGLHLLD